MAGAEVANGAVHEGGALALEEGRGGDEARCESSEQDGAGRSRPMFSVPFVQKVCFSCFQPFDGCFTFFLAIQQKVCFLHACLAKKKSCILGEG